MLASLNRIKEVPIFPGTVCEDMYGMCVTAIWPLAWDILYMEVPPPNIFLNPKYFNNRVCLFMCVHE